MHGEVEGLLALDVRVVGNVTAPDRQLEFAEEAERLGFDGVWHSHSIARDFPRVDTLMQLAATAARTRRVRLGTAVLQAPLYPPVALARMLTTLDLLSGGRLLLGVGTGWVAKEFENLGVPFSQRAGRTDEVLEILRRLWTEEEVTHEGKYYTIREARLLPGPAQQPHPPILIGGLYGKAQRGDPGGQPHRQWSERAARRIARFGDGWVTPSSIRVEEAPEILQEGMERIQQAAREHGREIRDADFVLVAETGPLNVSDSREQALNEAWQAYSNRVARGFHQARGNPSFEETIAHGAFGTKETAAAFVQKWIAVKRQVPALKRIQINIAAPDSLTQLRRFQREVMPLIRPALQAAE